MVPINKLFLTLLSFCSIVYTVSSFINLTKFLSDFSPKSSFNSTLTVISHQDSSKTVPQIFEAIVIDVALLCIFIIVHSSLIPIQEIMSSLLRTPVLNKLFYCLLTSASLELLIHWWIPIPEYSLWSIDSQEVLNHNLFLGIHTTSWIFIYTMMIPMDVTDLLGIKQVYCHITGRPTPSSLKPEQLKHLHQKMRHPSFLGFILIFWVHPYMRLDRLLLATLWSLYMLMVWRPDTYTYNYLVQQSIAKRSVL